MLFLTKLYDFNLRWSQDTRIYIYSEIRRYDGV